MDKLTEIAQREGNRAHLAGETPEESYSLYRQTCQDTLARGERAKELVGTVRPNGMDGQYTVGSRSGRAERYTVSLKHRRCHCPDCRNGYYCLHLIAAELYREKGQPQPAVEPAPVPVPAPVAEAQSLADSALRVIGWGEKTMLHEWLAEHDPTNRYPNSDQLSLIIHVARVAVAGESP